MVDKDPVSVFGRLALVVTSFVGMTMFMGGIIYFTKYSSGLISKLASIFIAYVGGWIFLSCMSSLKDAILEITDNIKSTLLMLFRRFN